MSVIFQPQPQHDVQVSCVVCAPVYSRGRYGELTNTISSPLTKSLWLDSDTRGGRERV